MDKITVVSGDTDSCAFDTGAYASSGTFFSGNASVVATQKLKDMILKEAAFQMNEKVEDLEIVHPGAVRSKASGKVLSYGELSHTAISGGGHGQMIAHGT
ncbi:MAG: molybdopterin cofactor-binding domain-containing protein, partial [Spirochaetales bacterium]